MPNVPISALASSASSRSSRTCPLIGSRLSVCQCWRYNLHRAHKMRCGRTSWYLTIAASISPSRWYVMPRKASAVWFRGSISMTFWYAALASWSRLRKALGLMRALRIDHRPTLVCDMRCPDSDTCSSTPAVRSVRFWQGPMHARTWPLLLRNCVQSVKHKPSLVSREYLLFAVVGHDSAFVHEQRVAVAYTIRGIESFVGQRPVGQHDVLHAYEHERQV